MSNTAFIFPGQGSQVVGMAKDLYEEYDSIRELYHNANKLLGFDLAKLSFEGPEEDLKKTNITQPALFVHSYAVFMLLGNMGIKPVMTAGHSLGEYSALVAAGALDFNSGLELVKIRGQVMQEAGQKHSGTMAAIIGLEMNTVKNICEQASVAGIVQPANFNSPDQIVISGSVSGVKKAIDLAKTQNAKRAIELNVSGAFHSPLMASAQDALTTALAKSPIQDTQIPVYCNVNARPSKSADEIRTHLEAQLISPVLWGNTMTQMVKDGADQFFEVGSGKVLTGLLRRIDRNITCIPIGTVQDIKDISL